LATSKAHHLTTTGSAFAQTFLERLHQVVGFEIPQLSRSASRVTREEVVPFDRHAGEKECMFGKPPHLLQRHGGVQRLG